MYIYIVSNKKEHTKNKLLCYCMEYCVIYRPELKESFDLMYFTDQIFFFNFYYLNNFFLLLSTVSDANTHFCKKKYIFDYILDIYI